MNLLTNKYNWLFLAFAVFWSSILWAQSKKAVEWKLEKDNNGVQVFTRKTKGFKMKEFKALAIVTATPDELLGIIRKVDNYTDWMSQLASSHVEKEVSENEIFVYTESNVPWPFSNRDIVTHSLLYWEGDKAYVKMTGMPDFIPKKKGIVRIPLSNGLWIFKPINEKRTEIIYQFQGDPGGKIPAWVANMFVVDGPYKTLLGMKKIAESNP